MDMTALKNAARSEAFNKRKIAFENDQFDPSQAVLELAKERQIIASYMAMRTEANPMPAMQALVDAGKRVVVPVILGQAQPLAFHEWRPDCEMVEGEFGAFIPKDTPALRPDFVLAPMVAFDDTGTRLGYGGGFYDRTMAMLRSHADVPYVGLAFEAQCASENLPREETDIPLDGIITQNGYRAF